MYNYLTKYTLTSVRLRMWDSEGESCKKYKEHNVVEKVSPIHGATIGPPLVMKKIDHQRMFQKAQSGRIHLQREKGRGECGKKEEEKEST